MANRKDLKKNLNNMVYDIVEECFNIQMFDESKSKDAEVLIDAAANYQDQMLTKINAAKTKADFRPITLDIENTAIDFINKLNVLN